MITIAELLDPTEREPLWPLLQQIGVRHAVSLLEAGEQRSRWLTRSRTPTSARCSASSPASHCWGANGIGRLKALYEDAGFELVAIEDTPPLDHVRLGLTGREEQLDAFCEQLRAMGAAGVPVCCYNWVAGLQLGAHRPRGARARRCADDGVRPRGDERGAAAARGGPRDRAGAVGELRVLPARASSPWPRRRACGSRCTPTTRRSRRSAASGASCAASRRSSASSSSCRARPTGSRCARGTSRS